MLQVFYLSRERVDSIVTVLVVSCWIIKVSLDGCLEQARCTDTDRDYSAGRSIHRVPPSFQMVVREKKKKRKKRRCCSAHHKQTDREEKPGCWFKGAGVWTGCRYSLSPVAAAASRFVPTTPTCFLSIKPTATASQRPGTAVRGRSRERKCSRRPQSAGLDVKLGYFLNF